MIVQYKTTKLLIISIKYHLKLMHTHKSIIQDIHLLLLL